MNGRTFLSRKRRNAKRRARKREEKRWKAKNGPVVIKRIEDEQRGD